MNDLNGGPGSSNPVGIPVVAVVSGDTNKSDFFIDPSSSQLRSKFGGVIDKGLFFYSHQVKNDPFFNINNGFAANGIDHVLVGPPDSELFELSKAAEGARNIWYESTGVWLERTADYELPVGAWCRYSGRGWCGFAGLQGTSAPRRSGVSRRACGSRASPARPTGTRPTRSRSGQTFTFDTSYKQKVFGVIGGIDGGWDYRELGLHGRSARRYLDSSLKFNASRNSIDYSGGTVGAYATYMNGGLLHRHHLQGRSLKMTWNATTLGQVRRGCTGNGRQFLRYPG